MVAKTKDCLGKRSLARPDTARPDRKQFVGLLTEDPQIVLDEGAHIVDEPTPSVPTRSAGHVTSSYHSPTLGRSIALALVRAGAQRIGECVHVFMRNRGTVPATITSPVFYDPTSERLNG